MYAALKWILFGGERCIGGFNEETFFWGGPDGRV